MAVLGFVIAVTVAIVVGAAMFVLGHRVGVVDRPDETLKTHSRPVVPLGGVAVFTGLHVGLYVADAFDPALFASTLLVWLLGLVDDIRGLGPAIRLAGAGLAGVVLVTMSTFPGGLLLAVVWAGAVVVVVNAVNLIDGVDGLAGLVSVAALGSLWWFGVAQETVGPHFYLVSIGAILGFLAWNLRPARLFLGDNGAYVVGVTLTWAALRASPDGAAGLVAVAIIGVPILDLVSTAIRRIRSRRSPLVGDRDHGYDRLMASGWGVGRVVALYFVAQVIWGGSIALVAILVSDLVAVMVAAGLGAVVVFSLTRGVEREGGRLG